METIYEKIKREKREPDDSEVFQYIKETGRNLSYYNAREELRELAYGGSVGSKPPHGLQSWGDYWKSY